MKIKLISGIGGGEQAEVYVLQWRVNGYRHVSSGVYEGEWFFCSALRGSSGRIAGSLNGSCGLLLTIQKIGIGSKRSSKRA